jgi:excinuclease ABC subunit B
MGRAARNVNGHVILYADRTTDNMQRAIDETRRRREMQEATTSSTASTPSTIRRDTENPLAALVAGDYVEIAPTRERAEGPRLGPGERPERIPQILDKLRKEMRAAAGKLEFERAAELRDRIKDLERWSLDHGIAGA